MKGGIYSEERCPKCMENPPNPMPRGYGRLKDNKVDGLQCPFHPEQRATKFRVIFEGLHRRVDRYHDAKDLLDGWRWEKRQDKFNKKDYLTSNPLGFQVLGEKFLAVKKLDLRPEGYRRYRYHYLTCAEDLGNVPVTQINYGVLEDLKIKLLGRLAPKTVNDTFGFLKTFLSWCVDRGEINHLPRFPKLSKKMGKRKILDKPTQAAVVEKVYEMYWNHAPRACIGIELLCTYPKIRPAELRQVQEKHIDLKNLTITIPSPKEDVDPKDVDILQEHAELIRSLPRGFPEMYFLRYDYPVKGRRVGDRFGRDYLYHVWRRACEALGVKGVPLYPGTKHTTISDWARKYSEARIQQAAGVLSDAIRRYTVLGREDCVSLYKEARPTDPGKAGKVLAKDFRGLKDVSGKKQ